MNEYDVVIIGAGTGGLSAAKEVERRSSNFLLVDQGPLGTTCTRVGCMPSKIFLQYAQDYSRTQTLVQDKVLTKTEEVQSTELLKRLREKREHFLSYALKEIEAFQEVFHQGRARLMPGELIEIEGLGAVKTRSLILATGSRPHIPKVWEGYPGLVLTTDQFFEQTQIPKRWAVIGLGPLALELGQGLSMLGCEVHFFTQDEQVAGIKDEEIKEELLSHLKASMVFHRSVDPKPWRSEKSIEIQFGKEILEFDRVLLATGRQTNLDQIGLSNWGLNVEEESLRKPDPETMRVDVPLRTRIYLAGDAERERSVLHEASDEGRIAGINAMAKEDHSFERRVEMVLSFTHPAIARVGNYPERGSCNWGKATFSNQGRSVILGENAGILKLAADRVSKTLVYAEIVAPRGEHLAELLALAISQRISWQDMLRMPFYHPTVEEGLRSALRDLKRNAEGEESASFELNVKKREANEKTLAK